MTERPMGELQGPKPCPYHFCSATPQTYITRRTFDGPQVEIIPMHELKNSILPLENCIAGLMEYPPTPEQESLLRQRERSDYNRILELERERIQQEARQPIRPPEPPTSTSMLPKPGSRRFGRTPATEEDQEDWKLGGRGSDELKTEPTQPSPHSPTISGQPLGRRAMSIAGVQAAIAAAAVEANGAHTSLGTADDPHLGGAIGALQEAERMLAAGTEGLDSASRILAEGNEDGSVTLNEVVAEYHRLGEEECQQLRGQIQNALNLLFEVKGRLEATQGEILGAVEKAAEYSGLIGS